MNAAIFVLGFVAIVAVTAAQSDSTTILPAETSTVPGSKASQEIQPMTTTVQSNTNSTTDGATTTMTSPAFILMTSALSALYWAM